MRTSARKMQGSYRNIKLTCLTPDRSSRHKPFGSHSPCIYVIALNYDVARAEGCFPLNDSVKNGVLVFNGGKDIEIISLSHPHFYFWKCRAKRAK
ncbi:hypothetical protein TNIN_472331 [Trichonephila inaurata madagascariensis]|uniref:Uncharacterized protein n=1 Tax=Trichonephila inaurata madagascariensis TaxID=2747483 RepID=A0A8X7C6R6_9ARAC|nr:hypothetical protein TNIN_472331 [Trichonephila inaurata madagascariensis]